MSLGSQRCSTAAELQSGSQPHGSGPCQLPARRTAGSKLLLRIRLRNACITQCYVCKKHRGRQTFGVFQAADNHWIRQVAPHSRTENIIYPKTLSSSSSSLARS